MPELYEQMLFGGDPAPDERRMMADQIRTRMSHGGQLSTSGIPEVAKQGALMQKTAQQQTEEVGLQRYRKQKLASDAASEVYKVSPRERETWTGEITTHENIGQLVAGFDDSFVSWIPATGNPENWLSANLEEFMPESSKAQQQWWATYRQFYENIVIHDLYGSAFTDPERKRWEANAINPNMSADQIKRRFAIQMNVSQQAMARRVKEQMAFGRSDHLIRGLWGDFFPPEVLDSQESINAYYKNLRKEGRELYTKDVRIIDKNKPVKRATLEQLEKRAAEGR